MTPDDRRALLAELRDGIDGEGYRSRNHADECIYPDGPCICGMAGVQQASRPTTDTLSVVEAWLREQDWRAWTKAVAEVLCLLSTDSLDLILMRALTMTLNDRTDAAIKAFDYHTRESTTGE